MHSRCGRGGLSKSLDNRWCPTWAWSRRWMWGNSLRSKEFPVRELLRRTVANLRRSCNSNVAFFSKRNAQGISTTLMPTHIPGRGGLHPYMNFNRKDGSKFHQFPKPLKPHCKWKNSVVQRRKEGLYLPAWGCSRTWLDHWLDSLENDRCQASSVNRKVHRTQTLHANSGPSFYTIVKRPKFNENVIYWEKSLPLCGHQPWCKTLNTQITRKPSNRKM